MLNTFVFSARSPRTQAATLVMIASIVLAGCESTDSDPQSDASALIDAVGAADAHDAAPEVAEDVADDAEGDAVDEAVTTWWVGTSVLQYGGTTDAPKDYLCELTYDPAAEEVRTRIVYDGRPVGITDFVAVYDVDGGEFTLDFFDGIGTFVGEGAFSAGEAWAWTAWQYDIAYSDGPYVGSRAVATVTVGELFESFQEVYSPDGDLEGTVTVTLDPVFEETWEREASALRGLAE